MKFSMQSLCVLLLMAFTARAEEEEAVRVYRSVQSCVVALENSEGGGTGILLDNKGLILTNAHVMASPLPFRCKADVRRGEKVEAATFKKVRPLGFHEKLDLALVRIDPTENAGTLQAAKLSRVKASPGQRVYAIGNPSAGGMVLNRTITSGLLSGVDRVLDGIPYYQISAPINPGNSGGPLCDGKGQVMGLVTLKFTDVENVGFAIPLDKLDPREFVPLEKRKSDTEQSKALLERADKLYKMSQDYRRRNPNSDDYKMAQAYAALYYRQALIQDPSNATLYYNVGMLLRSLDKDETASAYLFRAIELSPWGDSNGDYYRELGFSLVKQKKVDEALAAWREGLAKYPKTAGKIWEDISICYMQENTDYYQAAYAASVVIHLSDANSTRLPMARKMQADAKGRLDEAAKKKFDAAQKKIGDDLTRMDAEAKKARAANKLWLTDAFAKFVRSSGTVNGDTKGDLASVKLDRGSSADRGDKHSPSSKPASDAPESPELDLKIPEGSVDMLREIALAEGTISGQWKFAGGVLQTPMTPRARLQIDTQLPDEYDLTLIVQRKGNRKELVVGLVRGQSQTAFIFDGDGGQASGFDPQARGAYRGALLTTEPTTIVLKVRNEGLMITVDGKQILLQRQSEAFPAVPDDWKVKSEKALFLGSESSRFLIHKMMLTPYARKK